MTAPEALPSVHAWSYIRSRCETHGVAKHRWRHGHPSECCACVAASPDAAAGEAVQSAVHAKLANEHDPSACAVCEANAAPVQPCACAANEWCSLCRRAKESATLTRTAAALATAMRASSPELIAAAQESAQSRADTSPAVHEASVPVGGGVASLLGDTTLCPWCSTLHHPKCHGPTANFYRAYRAFLETSAPALIEQRQETPEPLDVLASAAAEAARALARMSGAIQRGDRPAAVQEARRASLELATVSTRMNESAPLEALQHPPQRGADGGAGVPNGELVEKDARPQVIPSAVHSMSTAEVIAKHQQEDR